MVSMDIFCEIKHVRENLSRNLPARDHETMWNGVMEGK